MFVTVFVDTSSSIANFSPSADKDPSLKFSFMDAEMTVSNVLHAFHCPSFVQCQLEATPAK